MTDKKDNRVRAPLTPERYTAAMMRHFFKVCRACEGWGCTRETAPVIKTERRGPKKVLRTVSQGSGCPTCKGIGRVAA